MSLAFILPNGKVIKIPMKKLKKIVTVKLHPAPHYINSNFVTSDEIIRYARGDRDGGLLAKINRYILFYAENMVLIAYLYILSAYGEETANIYLDYMKPLLEELREMNKKYTDPKKLISKCLEYGIDPF